MGRRGGREGYETAAFEAQGLARKHGEFPGKLELWKNIIFPMELRATCLLLLLLLLSWALAAAAPETRAPVTTTTTTSPGIFRN